MCQWLKIWLLVNEYSLNQSILRSRRHFSRRRSRTYAGVSEELSAQEYRLKESECQNGRYSHLWGLIYVQHNKRTTLCALFHCFSAINLLIDFIIQLFSDDARMTTFIVDTYQVDSDCIGLFVTRKLSMKLHNV